LSTVLCQSRVDAAPRSEAASQDFGRPEAIARRVLGSKRAEMP
jgi:hypothetical protein